MTREEIIKPENLVYKKPTLMNDNPMHYCPGCSHGVVHKLIAEVIEEMGMENKAVGVSPVGCAVFAYNYLDSTRNRWFRGRGILIRWGSSRKEGQTSFRPLRWNRPACSRERSTHYWNHCRKPRPSPSVSYCFYRPSCGLYCAPGSTPEAASRRESQ